MTPSIPPLQWADFVGREYLGNFVRQGGSAIKFTVSFDEEVRSQSHQSLRSVAESLGYLVAEVSAEDTKVHMPDQIFFRIAGQVPWQELSRRIVVRLAAEEGFGVPAEEGEESLLDRIASANQVDAALVKMVLLRKLGDRVFRHRALSRDFRVTMTHLCMAKLSGGPDGETTIQTLLDWLTGRNKYVSAVKPYQLFTRINRNNARHLFESLLRWIRFAGLPGLLVFLDFRRLAVQRNPKDDKLYYTKAGLLDSYEVLRQFIDRTDHLEGCLMVIETDVSFLDDDSSGRGIGAYQALKFRIFDEVHDRRLVNPMTSLVRLSECAGGPLA